MIATAQPTGHGWPMVAHPLFVGELTPSCPECGSHRVYITVVPAGGPFTGPGGRFRMGDPSRQAIVCNHCEHRTVY